MLYRLDRVTQAGTEPISDILGPILIRSWKHAKAYAQEAATADPDGCIIITRIGNAGQLSQAATVYPDGLITR